MTDSLIQDRRRTYNFVPILAPDAPGWFDIHCLYGGTSEVVARVNGQKRADIVCASLSAEANDPVGPAPQSDLPERLRDIAESIVDVKTQEGGYLLEAAHELETLRESEAEWQRRGDRAVRAQRSLRLILGLLSQRRWWNDNVSGAEQIAKEALLDAR